MSSSQNQFPQSSQTASSSPEPRDQPAKSTPDSATSASTAMDQHSDSITEMAPSASSSNSPQAIPPKVPVAPNPPAKTPDPAEPQDSQQLSAVGRQHPIPPASEPMQYRAIGLVRGQYQPSEEQFTRGNMTVADGSVFDTVLLGRVMSLVKKHIDLEQEHLWVVYPRTRNNNEVLHLQIVGIWEPEKLDQEDAEASEAAGETSGVGDETVAEEQPAADQLAAASAEPENELPEAPPSVASGADEPEDGYFSIRGEIIGQEVEQELLVVKIQQAPRRPTEQGKFFKLNLKGTVSGKAVGYFWDFDVQRQGSDLVVQNSTLIGLVPPRKRQGSAGSRRPGGFKGRGGGRREGAPRPNRFSGGDRPSKPSPSVRREPLAKPVKRSKDSNSSAQSNPES